MTGLHSGHCPVRANREIQPEGQKPLPAETVTVTEILKSAGYATGCTGMWGMGFFDTSGSPLKQGFDRFFGYNCQRKAHSYFPTYLWDNDQKIELPGNDGQAELVQRAEALMQASHQPSPDWPLDGPAPHRLADKSKPNKKTPR